MNEEEENKKVSEMVKMGYKNFLLTAERLCIEVTGEKSRKECVLQMFVDDNGVPKFVRRLT